MVVIRLARKGAKKRPFYHVVAADRRNSRDGRNIERLGYFNPIARGAEIRLHMDMDRITHWLNQGAQPSDRVAQLIKDAQKGPEAAAAERAKKAEKTAKKKAAVTAAAEAKVKAEAAAEAKAKAATEVEAEPEAPAKEATKAEAEPKAPAKEATKAEAEPKSPAKDKKKTDADDSDSAKKDG